MIVLMNSTNDGNDFKIPHAVNEFLNDIPVHVECTHHKRLAGDRDTNSISRKSWKRERFGRQVLFWIIGNIRDPTQTPIPGQPLRNVISDRIRGKIFYNILHNSIRKPIRISDYTNTNIIDMSLSIGVIESNNIPHPMDTIAQARPKTYSTSTQDNTIKIHLPNRISVRNIILHTSPFLRIFRSR